MIKSSRDGGAVQPGGGSYPLARKASGPGPELGHRSSPVENQGLLNRMDEQKDSFTESEYTSMLGAARAYPAYGDAGADYAQDEFERRHDRRQGVVQTHEYEGGPRIDSKNFPSDKDW